MQKKFPYERKIIKQILPTAYVNYNLVTVPKYAHLLKAIILINAFFPDLPGKIKRNINRKNNPSRKPLSGFNLSQTVQGNKTSNLSHSTLLIHFCNLLSFKLLQTQANPKQVSAFDLFSRLRPESLYS